MLYVYFNFFGYFDLAIRIEKCGNFSEGMILNRADNSSSKAFTRVLLKLIKAYYFCVPHATHSDV